MDRLSGGLEPNDDRASLTSRGRGPIRQLPVMTDMPSDLPITDGEIHMVLAALGAELATLFDEDR